MFKALVEKMLNMYDQMGNFRRVMETLIKNEI